ncbi:MAG: hypothetical protein ACJ735_07670 [Actinomycetes bacterium]
MPGHEHFEELAAGHALHALEPGDEQQFDAHLETCAECRRSLAEFSEVAAGLAMSSPEEPRPAPPPQVWESIRAQIDSERSPALRLDEQRRRRASPRWLAAAAAAVVIVAGVLGWQLARGGSSGESIQSALSGCRHTSGCHVVQLTNARNQSESAYLLIKGQDVRVATSSLPAIDSANQRYVLWQMPHDARPLGVVAFPLGAEHAVTVAHGTLTQPYDATTAFAISKEAGTTIPPAPSTPVVIGTATSA